MKLQRKSLGAFCCLAAEMCNFWKFSSRIKRPGLTPPTRSCLNFVVPDSQSHKFLVQIKSKHLTQKCDYPPLLNTSRGGGKKGREKIIYFSYICSHVWLEVGGWLLRGIAYNHWQKIEKLPVNDWIYVFMCPPHIFISPTESSLQSLPFPFCKTCMNNVRYSYRKWKIKIK